MAQSLHDLNDLRTPEFHKSVTDEDYLRQLNQRLSSESENYIDKEPNHPFIFVFGLPRSGTTITAQLLAYHLKCSFINNVSARFWLAPVTGIALSRILLSQEAQPQMGSNYAETPSLTGLHEFGYFWRHWLQLNRIEDFTRLEEIVEQVDWAGLRKTLVNIQQAENRPMVMKNIFGAHFLPRFLKEFPQSIFVYIQRDLADVAVSILNARMKFYGNPDTWWSTIPPDYKELEHLKGAEQVAGQVASLSEFYNGMIASTEDSNRVIRVNLADLCRTPKSVSEKIISSCNSLFGKQIELASEPPESLPFRNYQEDQHYSFFNSKLSPG